MLTPADAEKLIFASLPAADTEENASAVSPSDMRGVERLLDEGRRNGSKLPVTALVDRMVKAGHVARERDSADRRRVLLQVTPSAVTLGESFFGPLISRAASTVGNYTATERATIESFIAAMRADVERTRVDREPSR